MSSRAHVESMIDFVKANPVLYNYSHPGFKSLRAKNEKWMELGKILNEDWATLKKKWRNLKDTYTRHIKGVEAPMDQASLNHKKYRHWQWSKQMEFMKPHLGITANISRDEIKESPQSGEEEEAEGVMPEAGSPTTVHVKREPDWDEQNYFCYSQNTEDSCVSTPSSCNAPLDVRTLVKENQNSRRAIKLTRKKDTNDFPSVEKVFICMDKKSELDAVDHQFLSWAQTMKTFSPRRLLATKITIANIIMENEKAQLEEDLMDQQPGTEQPQ